MENVEFRGHLEPFLHEKTQHFMHELISFAKSPYDMIAYDNKVHYNWPEDHPQALEQTREEGRNSEAASDASSQPGAQLKKFHWTRCKCLQIDYMNTVLHVYMYV